MNRQQLTALLDLIDPADSPSSPNGFPFEGNVFIRTVTHYHVGRVSRVTGGFVVLADAAWVADTGRFSECLATGKVGEVEPFPGECAVSLGAIIDVAPWPHDLLRQVQ